MQSVDTFKTVALIVIWLMAIICGLAPIYIASRHQSARAKYALDLMSAATGGVFLAGGFLHLLTDALGNEGLIGWGDDFPYAQLFCTVGFLLVLIIEQSALSYMQQNNSDPTSTNSAKSENFHEVGTPAGHDAEVGHAEAREHSHLPVKQAGSLAVAVSLFLALSFHSVLAGLGLGAQTEEAWDVFIAIIAHKGLAAFALGTELVETRAPTRRVFILMVLFSLMTVIGIIIGWSISKDGEGSAALGVCTALSAGAFIYVAVMEVIPKQFARDGSSNPHIASKTIALLLGYGIFGMLALWV